MVEHLVANQMMGVRFSLPAPREVRRKDRNSTTKLACFCMSFGSVLEVDKPVSTGDKGQGTFQAVREIVSR